MTSLHEQAIGLFVFFTVLTTVTVGLRLFVRMKLCKGAFGWDDVALVVTWVGLMLWVGLAWKSVQYGFRQGQWATYHGAKNDVCYIISGTVKISVALVLYRLDSRPVTRAILIVDMVVCAIWTVVVTLILGVGCTENSPLVLSEPVCQSTMYAEEISYVFFNVLHVVIPVVFLWGIQIKDNLKWTVIFLFSVGILAAIAAVMKLTVYVDLFHPTPSTSYQDLWYKSLIWAVTEHGLSLFAASVLAVRPFFTYVSKGLTTTFASTQDLSTTAIGATGTGKRASAQSRASSGSGLSGHRFHRGGTELAGTVTRSGEELELHSAGRRGSDATTGRMVKQPYLTVDTYSESIGTSTHGGEEIREPGHIV